MHENLLELYLSRNGDKDLDVSVGFSPAKRKIPSALVRFHNRWELLHLIASIGHQYVTAKWIKIFGEILDSCRNMTFLRLRFMKLVYMTPFDLSVDPEAELNEEDTATGFSRAKYAHFYRTWHMPCLEGFSICNVVPLIPKGGLIALRVFKHAFLFPPCPNWTCFQHFLVAAQGLTELSLSFGTCSPANWSSRGLWYYPI